MFSNLLKFITFALLSLVLFGFIVFILDYFFSLIVLS